MLAAEYALGALEADQAEQVRRLAMQDAALAEEVAGWQARLAPLAVLAEPAEPPAGLWSGIAAELGLGPTSPRVPLGQVPAVRAAARRRLPPPARRRRGMLTRLWQDADIWRLVGVLGLTVGTGGIGYGLRQARMPVPVAVASLTTPGSLVAEARAVVGRDGTVTLRPAHAMAASAEQSLAVWALPSGMTAPVLLGAVAPGGGQVRAPALPDGSQIMVTQEPAGGPAPGGKPGRTLFAGVVTQVRSDSGR